MIGMITYIVTHRQLKKAVTKATLTPVIHPLTPVGQWIIMETFISIVYDRSTIYARHYGPPTNRSDLNARHYGPPTNRSDLYAWHYGPPTNRSDLNTRHYGPPTNRSALYARHYGPPTDRSAL